MDDDADVLWLAGVILDSGAGVLADEFHTSVRGLINHVHHADTWGLRKHLFATHPIPVRRA
ncbi:MAG: hypothetical protein V5B32_11980 [Candidatus Accumulibacter sp. UW26]